VDAVEIVNGTNVENDIAGIPFWHKLLNNGYKITAIGGSDDHSGGFGSAQPGTPTTMVWAKDLSEQSIIDGVKSGKLYLKTAQVSDPDIIFYAKSGEETWEMGETIVADLSTSVTFYMTTAAQDNLSAEWIMNGEVIEIQETGTETPDGQVKFTLSCSGLASAQSMA